MTVKESKEVRGSKWVLAMFIAAFAAVILGIAHAAICQMLGK